MSGILFILSLLLKDFTLFVSYIKSNTFPQPLPPEKEKLYLEKMAAGSREARNILIEHNLRLVAHLVKKFENTGEDTEDLISIGTIGLIKAIESYQVAKGTKLATYASRCIENEILMVLRSGKKNKKDVSLQDPIGHDKEGNSIHLMDILVAETEDITSRIQLNAELEQMKNFFHMLDERETDIIINRFGLDGRKEKTQLEIAKSLGISRSYVSRIEKRALVKLFHAFFWQDKPKVKINKRKTN